MFNAVHKFQKLSNFEMLLEKLIKKKNYDFLKSKNIFCTL